MFFYESPTAYVMADAGYDVWLPNHRGCFYSQRNLYKNVDDSSFWDFSWDDIGLYDYPPIFDYIRIATNQPKLYVIAHSQGTSSILALLSVYLQLNVSFFKLNLNVLYVFSLMSS